jgi:hypothetical protein
MKLRMSYLKEFLTNIDLRFENKGVAREVDRLKSENNEDIIAKINKENINSEIM